MSRYVPILEEGDVVLFYNIKYPTDPRARYVMLEPSLLIFQGRDRMEGERVSYLVFTNREDYRRMTEDEFLNDENCIILPRESAPDVEEQDGVFVFI